jgi:hypothetical protein
MEIVPFSCIKYGILSAGCNYSNIVPVKKNDRMAVI